jgi:hypothetical protein
MKLTNLFESDLIGKTISLTTYKISDKNPSKSVPVTKLIKVTSKTSTLTYDGDFDCFGLKLTSLKGTPASIKGDLICSDNLLTSFENCTPIIDGCIFADNNKFTSLKDIHKNFKEIKGEIHLTGNPIKSHVLGLLLIPGELTYIGLDDKRLQDILLKHIPNTTGNKGVLACQNALLDAGFDDFAQI